LVGFNFVCHHLVLGVEGSGAYVWSGDSRVDHFDTGGTVYRLSTSTETHYLATVGPRIGWTFCRFLPFVTGGAAFANLDFANSITFPGGGPTNFESGRKDETTFGWFVGGGLEYALTNHWHLRGDYKYADLGDVEFKSNFAGGGAPAFSRADLREHSATFGVVFQF
jgi:outer membrane immunogenic protein